MLELFAVRHICCQQIQLGSVLYISPVLPHLTEDQLRHELGKTEPSSGKEGSMTVAKHKEHNITLIEPSNGRGGSLTRSNKENISGLTEPNGRGGSKTAAKCEKHIIISDLFRNGSHGYFSCMCRQITNLLGIIF